MKLIVPLFAVAGFSLFLSMELGDLVDGGRIEISVGKKWPWRRFYSTNGAECINIGFSLFDMPGEDMLITYN